MTEGIEADGLAFAEGNCNFLFEFIAVDYGFELKEGKETGEIADSVLNWSAAEAPFSAGSEFGNGFGAVGFDFPDIMGWILLVELGRWGGNLPSSRTMRYHFLS